MYENGEVFPAKTGSIGLPVQCTLFRQSDVIFKF